MESAIAREEAAAREAAAERALQEEAMSGHPAFAAWLPRGLAARDATAAEHRRAETRSAEAASALGVARAAERAVEKLAELQATEVERARRRASDGAAGAERPEGRVSSGASDGGRTGTSAHRREGVPVLAHSRGDRSVDSAGRRTAGAEGRGRGESTGGGHGLDATGSRVGASNDDSGCVPIGTPDRW